MGMRMGHLQVRVGGAGMLSATPDVGTHTLAARLQMRAMVSPGSAKAGGSSKAATTRARRLSYSLEARAAVGWRCHRSATASVLWALLVQLAPAGQRASCRHTRWLMHTRALCCRLRHTAR